MSDKSASQHLFADVLARVHAICARAGGRGPVARRYRFLPRRGRAAARCDPWRHGDQRRDGARQGRQGEAARSRRRDRRETARRRSDRLGRRRRPRLHQPHPEAAGLGRRTAHRAARRRRLRQKRDRRTAPRSTSNTSRPTRPDRCMSAIAAARCSAMRWAACCSSRATTSRANITSTTPAPRSTCSRARRSCATARRSARTSARFRKGCIPATISCRSGRRSPPSMATS